MSVVVEKKKNFRDSLVKSVQGRFDSDKKKNGDKNREAYVADDRNKVIHDKKPQCLGSKGLARVLEGDFQSP